MAHNLSGQARQEIIRIGRAIVDEGKAPSVAFAVFDRDGIILADGYGDGDGKGHRPGMHTAFRIASMSKSFTAASVLSLVAEHQLDINAPITRYIPEFTDATQQFGDDAMPVTVAMLLSMSSGLATDDPWADRQESITREQLSTVIKQGLRYVFHPGEGFEYSNAGFAILGEIVHRVSGEPVAQYARDRFMIPLGMNSSGYDYRAWEAHPSTSQPAPDEVCSLAIGFSRTTPNQSWQVERFTEPGAFSSIGGVLSNVADLVLWCNWLSAAFAEPSESPDRSDINPHLNPLPRRYRRLMQTAHTAVPPIIRSGSSRGRLCTRETSELHSYGYGLAIEHEPSYGDIVYHPGGYPGYGSYMGWHKDSGLGVIVLANGRYAPASTIGDRIIRLALADTKEYGKTVRPWIATINAMRMVNDVLREIGTKMHDNNDSVDDRTVINAFQSIESIYSMNIELDIPLLDRANRLVDIFRYDTGAPIPEAIPQRMPADATASTEARLSWTIPCQRMPLRCTIAMNPLGCPQIETLEFTPCWPIGVDDLRETTIKIRTLG